MAGIRPARNKLKSSIQGYVVLDAEAPESIQKKEPAQPGGSFPFSLFSWFRSRGDALHFYGCGKARLLEISHCKI
jgi:hypothetical protein